MPIRVWLDAYPQDAPVDPSRVHVRLVDTVSGRVLDQRSLFGRRIANQQVAHHRDPDTRPDIAH